jgi:hypothetical protein
VAAGASVTASVAAGASVWTGASVWIGASVTAAGASVWAGACVGAVVGVAHPAIIEITISITKMLMSLLFMISLLRNLGDLFRRVRISLSPCLALRHLLWKLSAFLNMKGKSPIDITSLPYQRFWPFHFHRI